MGKEEMLLQLEQLRLSSNNEKIKEDIIKIQNGILKEIANSWQLTLD